ncbi:MAG: hypothetical protein U5L01_16440, partial [Rheinheimera sp.]|nr:hypothetical protein [Rheinheimera sp.]
QALVMEHGRFVVLAASGDPDPERKVLENAAGLQRQHLCVTLKVLGLAEKSVGLLNFARKCSNQPKISSVS